MAYLYSRYIVPKFEKFFRKTLVLDVGCGKGGLGAMVKTVPHQIFETRIVGLDLDLTLLRVAKVFCDGVICGSADHLPFRNKVFDATFCIEVIEHLDKELGIDVLQEMERVSKGLVMITTPSHFFSGASILSESMRHKSFWSPREFKKLGYRVEGLHPAREWIPPLLSKAFPYLACSTLAYKVFDLDK